MQEYIKKIKERIDIEEFFKSVLENPRVVGSEIRSECPFKKYHEKGTDQSPSFNANIETGLYNCHTCKSSGNYFTLYKLLNNVTDDKDAWAKLGEELGLKYKSTIPTINPSLVETYVEQLHNLGANSIIMRQLTINRGLTTDTIKKFKLGWDGERVTIPIFDELGILQNIRRYKWDSDAYKMISFVDELGNKFGDNRLYGIDNIGNDVIICEGEFDRLILEQNGFSSITTTAGAGSWNVSWNSFFKDKNVVIFMDNDLAGKSGAKKVADLLVGVARNISIIEWPVKYKEKEDISDLAVKYEFGHKEFLRFIEDNTISLKDESVDTDKPEPLFLHLARATDAKYMGKRIKTAVLVSGKSDQNFLCPKIVEYSCTSKAEALCDICGLCRVGRYLLKTFTAADKDLTTLIECTTVKQQEALKSILDIPKKCLKQSVIIKEYMNIEEVRFVPHADANLGFRNEYEYVNRLGMYLNTDLITNKRYSVIGYLYNSPQDQSSLLMFEEAIPEKNIVSDFVVTDEIVEQLKIFQIDDKTVEEKFFEIHEDFEMNVTKVWDRKDVAYGVDLVYHTVLSFNFQKQNVHRGWGEVLIIGDTGQAKTTLTERLMQHYKLGEFISGESASRTGLVYNVQKMGAKWFLTWGALPMNDTGLICIDEFSGIKEENLAELSEVRSSGVARSTKVISGETMSRTRGIYLTNPRNGASMGSESYPIINVFNLFGKAEDVRRLDFTVGVRSGDVAIEKVNRDIDDMPQVEHKYTTDLCNLLLLWTWSRKPEDVIIDKEATKEILQAAIDMGHTYSANIPIVEAADQRLKIARLAIATACRLFSTTDGQNVVVTKDHVSFVVEYLNGIYSAKALRYFQYSENEARKPDDSEESMLRLRKIFINMTRSFPVNDIMQILVNFKNIESYYFILRNITDITTIREHDLDILTGFLINNSLVKINGNKYHKLPTLNSFIEHIEKNPFTKEELFRVRGEDVDNL